MAEHPNAVRVRGLYEVGSGGDMDAIAGAFADDIVWHVPGHGANAGAHRGKEAVLAFFGRVIPGLESFNIEVHDVLATDTHAVALVRYDHRRERGIRPSGGSGADARILGRASSGLIIPMA